MKKKKSEEKKLTIQEVTTFTVNGQHFNTQQEALLYVLEKTVDEIMGEFWYHGEFNWPEFIESLKKNHTNLDVVIEYFVGLRQAISDESGQK